MVDLKVVVAFLFVMILWFQLRIWLEIKQSLAGWHYRLELANAIMKMQQQTYELVTDVLGIRYEDAAALLERRKKSKAAFAEELEIRAQEANDEKEKAS